jgi:hypothetical protein
VRDVAVGTAPSEDLQLMFLASVDALTPWHLRLLSSKAILAKRTTPLGDAFLPFIESPEPEANEPPTGPAASSRRPAPNGYRRL